MISLNRLLDWVSPSMPAVTLSNSFMFSLYLSLSSSTLVFFLSEAAGETYPVGVNTGLVILDLLSRAGARGRVVTRTGG